jgi:TonB family protein
MLTRLRSVGLSLILSLSGVAAIPYYANAQDSSQQQESKRKVKKRVEPVYPDIAKRMNLTGKVKLQVVISPDGRVTSTKELGGNALLVAAAEQAVKGWAFESASTETTEIVEFDFSGGSN